MAKPLLRRIYQDKSANQSNHFEDIDQYREKEVEEEILNRAIDIKASEDPKPPAAARPIMTALHERVRQEEKLAAATGRCQYCDKRR